MFVECCAWLIDDRNVGVFFQRSQPKSQVFTTKIHIIVSAPCDTIDNIPSDVLTNIDALNGMLGVTGATLSLVDNDSCSEFVDEFIQKDYI
jgi:hypothetical protein